MSGIRPNTGQDIRLLIRQFGELPEFGFNRSERGSEIPNCLKTNKQKELQESLKS